MPSQLAKAEVRRSGSAVVIAMSGDINAVADPILKQAYEDAAALSPTTVVLNFEAVDYINSTGIALIVSVLAEARKKQIEVRACGLSDHYRHIFEVTRLADFMPMFEDETTAVA
jgi:anti-sigma B factor antagonist